MRWIRAFLLAGVLAVAGCQSPAGFSEESTICESNPETQSVTCVRVEKPHPENPDPGLDGTF